MMPADGNAGVPSHQILDGQPVDRSDLGRLQRHHVGLMEPEVAASRTGTPTRLVRNDYEMQIY
jgi:hypothetical protein